MNLLSLLNFVAVLSRDSTINKRRWFKFISTVWLYAIKTLTNVLIEHFLIIFLNFTLQITYLIAFSCEVSWVLEAKGNLPIPSYLLCAEYFILFVSSAILIHGLSTVRLMCAAVEIALFILLICRAYRGVCSAGRSLLGRSRCRNWRLLCIWPFSIG